MKQALEAQFMQFASDDITCGGNRKASWSHAAKKSSVLCAARPANPCTFAEGKSEGASTEACAPILIFCIAYRALIQMHCLADS